MKFLLALGLIPVLTSIVAAGERPNTIELGGLFYSYDYKEVWEPPAKSNESGFLPGFYLGYAFRGMTLPLFIRMNLEYTTSQTTYDGGFQLPDGTNIPFTDKSKNILKRFELLGGYNFSFARGRVLLTPYTGYGYRFWRRSLPGGNAGYEEDYSWSYIPIGVRSDYRFGGKWSVGIDAVFRIMFGGGLDIKRESFGNPTLNIGNKPGYRISAITSYQFAEQWSVVFEPWYESSGIDRGDLHIVDPNTGAGVFEPESSTNIFGFSTGIQFRF